MRGYYSGKYSLYFYSFETRLRPWEPMIYCNETSHICYCRRFEVRLLKQQESDRILPRKTVIKKIITSYLASYSLNYANFSFNDNIKVCTHSRNFLLILFSNYILCKNQTFSQSGTVRKEDLKSSINCPKNDRLSKDHKILF